MKLILVINNGRVSLSLLLVCTASQGILVQMSSTLTVDFIIRLLATHVQLQSPNHGRNAGDANDNNNNLLYKIFIDFSMTGRARISHSRK